MYPLSYIWEDPLYENYSSADYQFNEVNTVAPMPQATNNQVVTTVYNLVEENGQKVVDQLAAQTVLY